jgi:hypothetical protein
MRPRELALHARLAARVSAPRLQMAVMVAITALSGFLASVLLAAAGMDSMWLRYPVCVGIAYLVFLAQIRLWRRWREADVSGIEGPSGSSNGESHGAPDWSGSGGSSGGAGASARFEAPSTTGAGGMDAEAVDMVIPDASLDIEHVWILPLLGILAGVLIALVWVVWSSPMLLSELALDAVLSTGLYRKLRRTPAEDWLYTTLRHTGWPFVTALLCSFVLGVALHAIAPGSTTLGEVFAIKQR